MARAPSARRRRLASILGAALLASGCASLGATSAPSWSFFERPDPSDAWTPQIASWQRRERALSDTELLRPDAVRHDGSVSEAGDAKPPAPGAPVVSGPPAGASSLRADWFAFRAEQKRALARNVAAWIQREARGHYIPDGPIDHWATLEETLARNGDDCDGLELLSFHFLLDLGFRQDEVYRAIVHHPADGQHHMVTLWFEDPADPWVIDPTGAMTTGMPRLSAVPGWEALEIFGENAQYTVRPGVPPHALPTAASAPRALR
jgi:hypothetical protein